VGLTLKDPPVEATHWTGTLMAREAGISVSSVQRIWRAHGLQPHRVRRFKLSNDPKFATKLRDVVGSMSIRRRMPSSYPSMRRARFRHLIVPNPACH
jgi:hypothetical protein